MLLLRYFFRQYALMPLFAMPMLLMLDCRHAATFAFAHASALLIRVAAMPLIRYALILRPLCYAFHRLRALSYRAPPSLHNRRDHLRCRMPRYADDAPRLLMLLMMPARAR